MKTNFKNLAIASAILFVPLKSTNSAHQTRQLVKKAPELISYVDLLKQKPVTCDFLYEPIKNLKAQNEAKQKINLIKMPKPTKNLDVSKTKFVGHPEFLNMFLTGVLKGKGEKFIEAQEKHGINASFLIGIANLESGNGFSGLAKKNNNIAGMRTNNRYMSFKSVDDCIDKMAKNLKKRYIDDGLTTIEQIRGRYAENPKWADEVIERMNPIYYSSKCKILSF